MNVGKDEAVCWCLVGALIAVAWPSIIEQEVAREQLQISAGTPYLATWQDDRTHSEVIDLLDRTIERMVRT